MHKRTQNERIFGRWIVVIDNTNLERFFKEKDAEEYKQFCIKNGMTAYIHEITDSEDDYIYYTEYFWE